MKETIRLCYGSSTNISNGIIDTGIPVKEWRGMDRRERQEAIKEKLYVLVDTYVENEGVDE